MIETGGVRHARWNARMWIVETSSWMVATTLIDATTVLPVLVLALSGSPFLASLIISIRYAGQGWPQLITASLVSGKPYRKSFYLLAVIPGRLLLLWPALLLIWRVESPGMMITAILVAYLAFWISEGFSMVPWVDMLGKTVHTQRRGRLFAAMHVVGGLLGVGAGLLVREVLNRPDLPFPMGYGVLFAFSLGVLVVSTISLGLLKEPPSPPHEERYSTLALIKDIPNLLRSMPRFRQLVILQGLFGAALLPAPFYILFASELLQRAVPGAARGEGVGIGIFLAVQTAGIIFGNALWGHLSDRYGNRLLLRALALIHAAVPILAILAGLIARADVPGWALYLAFAPTFLAFGSLTGGTWMGVTNYLLEIAPEHDRPAYIAVTNALNIPAVILPMAGGLLLRVLGYSVIFLIAAVILFFAFLLASRLPEPREK
ncbi:MAG: MFS transporter [Armatimonadota bacterium]